MTRRYRVRATPFAARQISGLRARNRQRFDQAMQEIATQGCAAFQYRLTGDGVDHFCDLHLVGRWRVLAAFVEDDVWVVAVGEHLRDLPEQDVYSMVYEIAEVETEPVERRTKPPCCGDDGAGPVVDQAVVDDLVRRATRLARRR